MYLGFYWIMLSCGRYGDFVPASVAGRWVTVIYVLSSTFTAISIIANLAAIPGVLHRRTTDQLILSQVLCDA